MIAAPATPLGRQIMADLPVLLPVTAVFTICCALLTSVGVNPLRPSSYLSNALLYIICWGFIEIYPFLSRLFTERPESPIRFLREYSATRLPSIIRGLPMFVALIVFMPVFSAMKSAIPLFTTFTWDATLTAADRALFGTDAWRVLQPVLGFPIVTAAMALAYHLWILLIYFGGIYFAAYCSDVELRRRYFLCYFGIWTICGVALAIAFASVGPCFVNPMLGLHTFDAQMAYLRSANEHFPIMVLKVQDSLLEWQHSGQHGLGRGITAMPSMHIAQTTLFWLGIRRVSPKAGYAFGAFLVVIYLGSIHLAYHYAVDGMIAAAVTVLLWLASRKLATSRMAADG